MPTTDPDPLRFELLQSDDYAKYVQREPREIAFILRNLITHRAMISAHFGATADFMLTTILALSDDEKQLYLDWGPDEAQNARVAASDGITCVTQLDKVKIQFALRQAKPGSLAGAKAFVAAVPDTLLRLQRREYYRLATPITHGPKCSLAISDDKGTEHHIDVTVLDISGGGVAVMVPPEGASFAPDSGPYKCRLTLPEVGVIETHMLVRSVFRITTATGKPMLRAGCQFVRMPDSQVSMIQRYILRVERERGRRA